MSSSTHRSQINIRPLSFRMPMSLACLAGNKATKIFQFRGILAFLKQIDEQGAQAEKLESVQRSAYQSAIVNLRNALSLYQRLKNSIQPEGEQNFAAELNAFESHSGRRENWRHARTEETFDRQTSMTSRSFSATRDRPTWPTSWRCPAVWHQTQATTGVRLVKALLQSAPRAKFIQS